MHRTHAIPIIITATFVLLRLCYAQFTLTWLGNTTCWEEATNWDSCWVPTEDNHVVIPGGLTFYPNLTYVTNGPSYCNNIYIAPGASLSFYDGGNAILEVNGDWQNEGTFNPGTGTVRLMHSVSCNISSSTFYNLENNKFTNTPVGNIPVDVYMTGDITILNKLSFYYGILNCASFNLIGGGTSDSLMLNNGELYWGRSSFPNTFETVALHNGTVNFYGTGVQFLPSAYEFYDLTLSSNGRKYLSGDITVTGGIKIDDGATFDISGHRVDLTENLNIADGIFMMGNESILALNGGRISVSTGCTFSAVGSGTMDTGPIVTRNPAIVNYYEFSVTGSGAVIGASYATFEYMNTMGVNIGSNATIDSNHPFDHCTFQHGSAGSANAALLRIDNAQDILIPYVNFPVMGAANVLKEVDNGRVVMFQSTGLFAGEAYEADLYNRINWISSERPEEPVVVNQCDGTSTKLTWNTVREDITGISIDVEYYIIYSDLTPTGLFAAIEDTVFAPDTAWIDTNVILGQPIKFYKVTAFDE